jgi:protein-S-isoprenylcysteine O-methyltransferase Ste14
LWAVQTIAHSARTLSYVPGMLLLGSWLGLLVLPLILGALTMPIFIEEAVPRKGLARYRKYAARVRYRLVPGVW